MKTYKEICRKFLGTPFIHVFAFRYNKENTDELSFATFNGLLFYSSHLERLWLADTPLKEYSSRYLS